MKINMQSNSIFLAIIFFVTLFNAVISFSVRDIVPHQLGAQQWLRKTSMGILLVSSTCTTNPSFSIAVDESAVVISQSLSAKDLIEGDIKPKVNLLKDILFVLKLYPTYVEKKEFVELRQAMRQEPVAELRRTCIGLEKYLSANLKKDFDKSYRTMIESLDNLDVIALRRSKSDDSFSDQQALTSITSLIQNYENMLKTLE